MVLIKEGLQGNRKRRIRTEVVESFLILRGLQEGVCALILSWRESVAGEKQTHKAGLGDERLQGRNSKGQWLGGSQAFREAGLCNRVRKNFAEPRRGVKSLCSTGARSLFL